MPPEGKGVLPTTYTTSLAIYFMGQPKCAHNQDLFSLFFFKKNEISLRAKGNIIKNGILEIVVNSYFYFITLSIGNTIEVFQSCSIEFQLICISASFSRSRFLRIIAYQHKPQMSLLTRDRTSFCLGQAWKAFSNSSLWIQQVSFSTPPALRRLTWTPSTPTGPLGHLAGGGAGRSGRDSAQCQPFAGKMSSR